MERTNPLFSWSSQRERMRKECELCYGLWYYGSYKGWDAKAGVLSQAAYRWKKTILMQDILSSRLNERIQQDLYLIRSYEKEMNRAIRQDLNRLIKQNRSKEKEWYASPKKNLLIREMTANEEWDIHAFQNASSLLDTFIAHYYRSKTREEVVANKATLLHFKPKSESGIPCVRLPEWDDMHIFVGLQCVFQKEKDEIVSVLFKQDAETTAKSQLVTMAMYLNRVMGVPFEKMTIREEFLATGMNQDHAVTKSFLQTGTKELAKSLKEMQKLLVDGDKKRNEPLSWEHFSRNPAHREGHTCSYCECVRKDLQTYPQGYQKRWETDTKIGS